MEGGDCLKKVDEFSPLSFIFFALSLTHSLIQNFIISAAGLCYMCSPCDIDIPGMAGSHNASQSTRVFTEDTSRCRALFGCDSLLSRWCDMSRPHNHG